MYSHTDSAPYSFRMNRSFVSLVALFLVAVNTAFPWIKFTDEELNMTVPDWCSEADAMVLDKAVEGEVYLTRSGFELMDIHSIRIKIFTEEGKNQGIFPIIAQEGHKIKNIKARTISPEGTVTKVKKSQIIKKKTFGGIENNQRFFIYQITFPAVQTGSILELSFESFTDNVYFMSPYYLDVRGIPTQSSTLTFTIPSIVSYLKSGMNTNLYEFTESIEEIPSLSQGNKVQYNAKASRIASRLDDPFAPGEELIRPHIYFVFSQVRIGFVLLDIVPDWRAATAILEKTLDDYLNDKRVEPDRVSRIQELYADTPAEVALYRWVTDSIQWVDSRSWIDFSQLPSAAINERHATGIEKALTLIKLYRDAEIPARLLLVNPIHQSRTMTRLPTMLQFNTYLVQAKINDSFIYLDPTKSSTAFGRYPWYFEGASALVVDSTCAEIITIPLTERINQESWNLKASIDSSGNLLAEGSVIFFNQYCQDFREQIVKADSSALTDFLRNLANAEANLKVLHCEHLKDQDSDTSISVSFRLGIDDYAVMFDNDILYKPDFIQRLDIEYRDAAQPREVDVYLSCPKRSVLSIETTFPDQYTVLDDPRRIRLAEIPNIQYRVDIIPNQDESKLLYRRIYMRESYCFPAQDYGSLCEFWRTAGQYDRTEVAFTKTQGN